MYQENTKPLPEGDASIVFAQQLAAMKQHAATTQADPITPDSVVRWADKRNQPYFASICRRLLLPGSGIVGADHLRELVQLAKDGNSCVLCLNHRSNLDVPTLQTLLEDHAQSGWFDKIIWVAGRKLEEDVGLTNVLVQCINRIIVTPHSWFSSPRSEDEIHEARLINIAAERAIARLRHQGWVFALFPSGTRIRPDDESTRQAIEQTDSYLRMFDYLALCNIDGCTMPVSKDRDFTHESPRLDRMLYTFGPVLRTEDWRDRAAIRYPDVDRKTASAQAIREEIESLAPTADRNKA